MNEISNIVFGFDIDGVLTADDDGQENIWLQRASLFFKQKPIKPSFSIEEAFGISSAEVQKFLTQEEEVIFDTVPIRPHCAQILRRLWRANYTIYLITAREERHREVTEGWLKKHELPYNQLFMSPTKEAYCKGERCQELQVGFFVDDRLENAHDVARQGVYTLLFHASHNRDRRALVPRVKSWLEIEQHIDLLFAEQTGS